MNEKAQKKGDNEMNEKRNEVAVGKAAEIAKAKQHVSVMGALAAKLEIDPNHLMSILKKTAFSTCRNDEEFMAMCMVANKYGLDPITKEIYAFPNKKTGAVVPVVGYDGWQKLANRNPNYDGVEFEEAEDGSWCECRIFRKDRSHPTAMREWLEECRMDTLPWQKYPRRMLRNKAFNQCCRAAFNLSGIYDPDEAERIARCEEAMAIALEEPKRTQLCQRRKSPTQMLGRRAATIDVPVSDEEPPADATGEREPAPASPEQDGLDVDDVI